MSVFRKIVFRSAAFAVVFGAALTAQAQAQTQATPSVADANSKDLDELRGRIDVLAEELNKVKTGERTEAAAGGAFGFAPSASKVYRSGQGVSLGGYGEILYTKNENTLDNGVSSGSAGTDRWDALRGIVYLGYKFNDRFLVNTEIEIEHANEAFLEFAYVDAFLTPGANIRAGLMLMPMGFVNELHEPTVFLGSDRPDVETAIIPTTWRENGVGLFGDIGPVTYRTYIVNGFNAKNFSASGLRGGRQKGSNTLANGLAWVARADVQPAPGAQIGVSGYIGKSGQDQGINVSTRMVEAHAEWKWRGLELRLLGTQAWLGDVAELNAKNGLTGTKSVGSRLYGYYVQAGYDVFPLIGANGALIPFFRWEKLNTQAAVPGGYAADPANDRRVTTVGLQYLPHEQVVFKLDYQDHWNRAQKGLDQVNFTVGYAF